MSILAIALNPTIDVSSEVHKISPTRKMRTFNQLRHAGGGGVNVARVVAELGGQAELLVMTGGATGALLEDTLETLPIRLHLVQCRQPTRIAFMVHEEQTGLEYRFVPEGPEISPNEMKPVFEIVKDFTKGIIVGSGSLPRGVSDDAYAKMADLARANGVKFILDTSGTALRKTLETSKIFLFKPSMDELEDLLGRSVDEDNLADAAMQFVTSGASEHVAVTLGSKGALLASASGIIRLPAIKVAVRSAVGAGDSFIGAMALALDQGRSIEDAFRYGMAAGAATAMTPGTELCHARDVETLYGASKG